MSLNKLIRSASRLVPIAVRASAGSRWCSHRHHSSAFSATVNGRVKDLQSPRSFPSILHRYSTEISSDESLLKSVEYEIECANDSYSVTEAEEEVPEGFPFKIENRVGSETVSLTREYQGETISVDVYMPNLVTGDEDDDDASNQSSIPLVVKTSKRSGPYLEFGCTAYPDEIVIDSLSVKDPENSEDQIAYEGPDFGDLDENLQKALHRYLEIRGIKASTTNFLHGYMINKDTTEYVEWLKKIQKFLQA
ncbi:hypothetical protein SASPL_145970 [Salvia splendens]|uniref:Mitochondrial glycoprotein n=1 Tax=Salvia splendens TaxID=180675 RepID=A0A8X8Z8K5_SALSN|nr:uncharacterized protein At2g39795, mitochondrial-like [Salvia splendens]KAG6395327.1 hypothetical protein SASPL_145970 [Salvia splendens]